MGRHHDSYKLQTRLLLLLSLQGGGSKWVEFCGAVIPTHGAALKPSPCHNWSLLFLCTSASSLEKSLPLTWGSCLGLKFSGMFLRHHLKWEPARYPWTVLLSRTLFLSSSLTTSLSLKLKSWIDITVYCKENPHRIRSTTWVLLFSGGLRLSYLLSASGEASLDMYFVTHRFHFRHESKLLFCNLKHLTAIQSILKRIWTSKNSVLHTKATLHFIGKIHNPIGPQEIPIVKVLSVSQPYKAYLLCLCSLEDW